MITDFAMLTLQIARIGGVFDWLTVRAPEEVADGQFMT
jgi:hypothetical protein